MCKDNPEEKWEKQNLGIKNLVFCNYEFVVFINTDNECDWKTSDEFDKILEPHKKQISRILTRAKHIESQLNEGIPEGKRDSYRILICDAISVALQIDFENANSALEKIHSRLAKEWSKTYRIAQVLTSIIFFIIAFLLINILLKYSIILPIASDVISYSWFLMGVLGAMISVIMRNANIAYESSSHLYLHILESIAKLVVGGTIGCVAVFGVKSGIILSFLADNNPNNVVLNFVAFSFGFSEKLIPLLTKPFEKELE